MEYVSDYVFSKIMDDGEFNLPIEWDGDDFLSTISNLFDKYLKKINAYCTEETTHFISFECDKIKKCIEVYLNGLPSKSYEYLNEIMIELIKFPLNIFIKAIPYTFRSTSTFPPIEFYRVVKVQKEKDCDIKRLFHVPYNLRSKISTSRYSIAGYPCLYLGTSLDLCCEELNVKPLKSEAFVSKLTFKHIVPNTIKVIDLAIKPQDFLNFGKSFGMVDYKKRRFVRLGHLTPDEIFVHYLLWYPLLAACSYIRNDRTANFSAEYIVSQVLMQWLSNYNKQFKNELFGLRYFSCASKSASEKGFNYVFPTSGKSISSDLRFCPILSQCFELTKPRDLRKYRSLEELEQDLDNDKELFSIYDYLPLYIDE